MNDRSRMQLIRRRKWSSATNDSKSMLALACGLNACTPCMAASLRENGCARNTTPPETQSTKENQAESKLIQSALFQQAPTVSGTSAGKLITKQQAQGGQTKPVQSAPIFVRRQNQGIRIAPVRNSKVWLWN